MKENYKFIHHSFVRACDTALHLLQKGVDFTKDQPTPEATAGTEKISAEQELLSARLYPDMFDFKKQIQVFSDNVAGGIARGGGLPKPSMPDTETTFAELIARVEKTKDFILSINPDTVEGIENLKIKLPWMPEGMYFDATTYFGDFVMQNTMFHLVTAYDILRHKGVQIGKQDFTGHIEMKKE